MRFRVLSCRSNGLQFAVGLCAVCLIATWPASAAAAQQASGGAPAKAAPAKPTAQPAKTPRTEKDILDALHRVVPFDFSEQPLASVAVHLGEVLGLEVKLDTHTLEDAGIMPDTPITFESKSLSTMAALNQLLRPLGLTWTICDETLLITTPEEAENHLITRVYNVADLITPRPSYRFERMYVPGAASDPFPRELSSNESSAKKGQPRDYAVAPLGRSSMGVGGAGMGGMVGGVFCLSDQPAAGAGSSTQSATAAPVIPPASSDACPGVGTATVPPSGNAGSSQNGDSLPVDSGMTMENLIEVIVTSVKPVSWDDVGGPGSITAFGDAIIISQTLPEHLEVEQLLAALRAVQSQRTVAIRATWLSLDVATLNTILTSKDKKGIDRAALTAAAEKAPGYVGAITCFSGQTVHIAATNSRTAVTSSIPIVSSGAVAYQPVVNQQPTVMLQVTPQFVPQTDSVVLDLCSVVTRTGAIETERPAANDSLTPAFDRVKMSISQLGTTLKVPLNEPVLVGGLSCPTGEDKGTEPAATAPQLYLFIEATVK